MLGGEASQPAPHALSQDTLYTGLPSRSIDFALGNLTGCQATRRFCTLEEDLE